MAKPTTSATSRKRATTVYKKNPVLPTYYVGYRYMSGPKEFLVKSTLDVPAACRRGMTMVAYDQDSNQVVAELKKF